MVLEVHLYTVLMEVEASLLEKISFCHMRNMSVYRNGFTWESVTKLRNKV